MGDSEDLKTVSAAKALRIMMLTVVLFGVLAVFSALYREIAGHKIRYVVNVRVRIFFQGLTHSALGLSGRFVVLLRLWCSHSLIRVSNQPLS
jgi:hypothetical protein